MKWLIQRIRCWLGVHDMDKVERFDGVNLHPTLRCAHCPYKEAPL